MSQTSWILFPCQLFHWDYIQRHRVKRVFLMEDPLFYGKRGGIKGDLHLNQLRLVYMRVCHRHWMAEGKKRGISVASGTMEDFLRINPTKQGWVWIDPCDLIMEAKMKNAGFDNPMDSPSFLLTRSQLDSFKSSGRFQHSTFYKAVKEWRRDIPVLNRLRQTPNLDRENRRGYHRGMPEPPKAFRRRTTGDAAEWREAIAWVSREYPRNPKPLIAWDTLIENYLVYLPIEPDHARQFMRDFFKERFKHYGEYQDVVLMENPLGFHSGLSIYLNNGFITPEEVLRELTKYTQGISAPTLEGFVRQIAGWREYCRLYYYRVPEKDYRLNIFQGRQRRAPKAWYQGTTGILPLDDTIRWAMNYGYINHIQRLMIVSNFMTLDGFHPDALYHWMFEFSLDSYEWVMIFNCYSMGSWSDGGIAMRKPYISSAAYLRRMTNERSGEWETLWTNKYKAFMKNKADILKHTQAWRP
jgi:deoxyribodipyrimidine photolyase-related protein